MHSLHKTAKPHTSLCNHYFLYMILNQNNVHISADGPSHYIDHVPLQTSLNNNSPGSING